MHTKEKPQRVRIMSDKDMVNIQDDKERLENISPTGFDLNGNVCLKCEDYHWLMERAERVEELEKELNEWQNEALRLFKLFEESQERLLKVEYVEELEKELNEWQNEALRWIKLFEEYQELNKRYREALEHIERIQSVDVAQQIARQALEGTE